MVLSLKGILCSYQKYIFQKNTKRIYYPLYGHDTPALICFKL